ncbi:hypothetical protein [Azohydromonas lata]|uniref:hypothetical protein n=1 Tax=Azohydromonas lata TaxID=45677 RepID=UPI00082C81DC|nr:hypothetical protein [Azohydromonas lata]
MAIAYEEKGAGLHERIRTQGHWLVQEDGAWQSSDDAAVQAIIDAYTLDDARAPIIAAIKQEAMDRILAFLPAWKQSNLNARMNELNEARFVRSLSIPEVYEVEAMRGIWDKAKAIRAASDAHEAALKALGTFSAVLAYPWRTTGWPTV